MMKKHVLLFVFLSLTATTANGFAQCNTDECTPKSGVINGETWVLEDSPICVEGDITVVDLTIDPGVIVEFCGDHTFEITGTLNAVGSADAKIEFKAGTSGWQGMKILDTAGNCELAYCIISGSVDGGLQITNSTPIIRNVYITGNSRENSGAGLRVSLATSPVDQLVIENSTISNNTSKSSAGGIHANLAAGSMIMRNCKINNNTSTYTSTGSRYGGGIYAIANGGLKLENCEISGNQAKAYYSNDYGSANAYGGGLYVREGNVELKNCVIKSNHTYARQSGYHGKAWSYGAGIFANTGMLKLKNCIVSNNSNTASADYSYPRGGGIYNSAATVDIENCTIVSNISYGIYTSGITHVANSIIYFNSGGQINGSASVNHSDVQGGHAGEGNINEDPLFENIFTYQLRCDYSPCVDVGNAYPWYNDACFPLPSCGTAHNDMGAYGGPEACGWCSQAGTICLGPCQTPAEGDFNWDGDVDGADLFIFSNNYGSNPPDND